MPITTMTSREFNQDTSRAKKAARQGPVFITDRGQPAHVLLSIEAYHALANQQASVLDLLAMPETAEEVDFDPPKLQGPLARPADVG
jgi:prevent-host-death family protein